MTMVWLNMANYGQLQPSASNMTKYGKYGQIDQVWLSMDQGGQLWSSLNNYDQLLSIMAYCIQVCQVWPSLSQYG